MAQNETELLLEELKDSVASIGVKRTINALRDAKIFHINDQNTQHVVNSVCKRVGISFKELKDYRMRSDTKKVAIALCIYFLHSETCFNLSHDQIAQRLTLGMTRQSVRNYYLIIKNAKTSNPKSNIDKLVCNHLAALTSIILPKKITA